MAAISFIENYEDGSVALYNLKDDSGEQNDLKKEQPEKVVEMRKKLHAWYKKHDAKFLVSKGENEAWKP